MVIYFFEMDYHVLGDVHMVQSFTKKKITATIDEEEFPYAEEIPTT